MPGAATIGVLINPNSPEVTPQLKEIEAAARAIGQPIQIGKSSNEGELTTAFTTLVGRAGALLVSNDAVFMNVRQQLVALAARHRLPTIYDGREYAAAGGLISYGTSYSAAYRELGIYVGKILKGAKPADLPVDRARHQHEDRQGARPRYPADPARPRRRGDRIDCDQVCGGTTTQ